MDNLPKESIEEIKKRGCVVVKNIVDDQEALRWKEMLRQYVAENEVDGLFILVHHISNAC